MNVCDDVGCELQKFSDILQIERTSMCRQYAKIPYELKKPNESKNKEEIIFEHLQKMTILYLHNRFSYLPHYQPYRKKTKYGCHFVIKCTNAIHVCVIKCSNLKWNILRLILLGHINLHSKLFFLPRCILNYIIDFLTIQTQMDVCNLNIKEVQSIQSQTNRSLEACAKKLTQFGNIVDAILSLHGCF